MAWQPPQQSKHAFTILKPEDNPITRRLLKGREYLEILDRVRRIAYHQQEYSIHDGIRGFIFHGEVGIGKTTCAKAVASELGVPLVFVDGADIARPLYGESEMQVSRMFDEAQRFRYAVVLIDDCESVFPSRDWLKAESWHVAQNNVFFHKLDQLDTTNALVILTTNRYDLLDKAVKDRLYSLEFPLPSPPTMQEIAEFKCSQLRLDPSEAVAMAQSGRFRSVRELERFLIEKYIDHVLKHG